MVSYESEMSNPQIQEWLNSLVDPDRCWFCGQKVWQTSSVVGRRRTVHHIDGRNWAPADKISHPCNLFIVCSACHTPALHSMDVAAVLARKLLHDPENFNLDAWLRLRDPELKAPERVTLREIVNYLDVRR